MSSKGATILTPLYTYVPESHRNGDSSNVGDGFILEAILRLIRPVEPAYIRSCRVPLTEEEIERINQTRFVVLAGADQLRDDYTIVPGMTPELFAKIKVPVIPMGIGWKGHKSKNQGMTKSTVRMLEMMHERIEYSSWRCERTRQYLINNVPGAKNKAMMTACPVQYQEPIMQGVTFTAPRETIAVTVTDRGKFWERESAMLKFVAAEFPKARRILSLHQDYSNAKPRWKIKHLWSPPKRASELHVLAESLGYERFHSESPEDFFAKYREIDGHFGSRLHAHLYVMGQGKASYLVRVDDRSTGISESSDFKLYDPATFGGYQQYDFERYRTRLKELWPRMNTFLTWMRGLDQ